MEVKIVPYSIPGAQSTLLSSLLIDLETAILHGLALVKLELKQSATNPAIWKFIITYDNGRIWDQTLRYDGTTIWHTFDVVAEFVLPEVSALRNARDKMEQFVRLGCTELEITF